MRCISILITGHVQGVMFRHSAKVKADALGIVGFVRNASDGSVYIEAEGREKDLHAFVAWCKKGPFLAKVKTCRVEERAPQGFHGFMIR